MDIFNTFAFQNGRPITKSMLAWWAFHDDTQGLLSLETVFEIEHIFAKNRQDIEKSLRSPKNLEVLGNKAMLEKRINIRASDYRFVDKIKYYQGFTNGRGQIKKGTKVQELLDMSKTHTDFVESDIQNRNRKIIKTFIEFLKSNNLSK